MTVTIHKEHIIDIAEDILPMLHDHWEEVAVYKDKQPLDPDWDWYEKATDSGICQTLVFRLGDEIVGYSIFFVKPHPHYRNHKYAVNDIVYIKPEHRKEYSAGLFKAVEGYWKSEGVDVITYHMKVHKPWHRLMEGLEYDHQEHLYSKYIGE